VPLSTQRRFRPLPHQCLSTQASRHEKGSPTLHPKAPSSRALGVRQKLYHNRQVSYRVGDVITDACGNILKRPLTERLVCFGDPVERVWGRFDEPRHWGDEEPEPNGCAMCPVAMFCGQVVHERIESSADLRSLYYEWERATATMTSEDRHRHPSWTAFVVRCEESRWHDDNDRMLQEKEDAKIALKLAKAKQNAAANRRRKRKPRTVPKRIQNAIQDYRDARRSELLAVRAGAKPPLWLRNRSEKRCVLIADAWWARELLEWGNRKSSANEVRKLLLAEGRLEDGSPNSLTKRVNDALNRADRLTAEGKWPFFDPEPNPLPCGLAGPTGMPPSVVHTLLEDS